MRESEGSKSGKDWPRGIVGTQASGDGGGADLEVEEADLEVEADLDAEGMY
jgi:hypothetical protein